MKKVLLCRQFWSTVFSSSYTDVDFFFLNFHINLFCLKLSSKVLKEWINGLDVDLHVDFFFV